MGMLRYLLDTNILSDLIRHPNGRIAEHLQQALPATACTSIVVASEIYFGLAKRGSEPLRRQAERILGALEILPLESPADRHYGEIRAHLTRRGELIGQNDLFIAAHARSLELILVTGNENEFSRVPGLTMENWLAD